MKVQGLSDVHEISIKGPKILESLPEELKKDHRGRFIAIEVESGEFYLGDTAIEATQKARAKHPDEVFFLGRIGYRAAYTFKGHRTVRIEKPRGPGS
jgi:hypothetical protein